MWVLSSSDGKLKETSRALLPGAYILGRSVKDDSSNIQVVSKSISKRHVQITVSPPKANFNKTEIPCAIEIQDLDTKFGTAVNDERVCPRQTYEKNASLEFSLGKCPTKFYLQWNNISICFDDQETMARWSTPLLLIGVPNSIHINHSITHFVPRKDSLSSVKVALAYIKDIKIVNESFVEALVNEKEKYLQNTNLIPKDISYLSTGRNHNAFFPKSAGDLRNSLGGLKCCSIDLDQELPKLLSLLGLDVHRHHTDDVQFLTSYYGERNIDFVIILKQKVISTILSQNKVFCLTFSDLWNILKEDNPKEVLHTKKTSHQQSKSSAPSTSLATSENVLDELFSNFKPVPRSPRSKRTLKSEGMLNVSKPRPPNSPLKKDYRENLEEERNAKLFPDNSKPLSVSSTGRESLDRTPLHESNPELGKSKKKTNKKDIGDKSKVISSHFAPLTLSTAGESESPNVKVKKERETSPLLLKAEHNEPPDTPLSEENLPKNLGSVEFISIHLPKKNEKKEAEFSKYKDRPNFKKFRRQGSKVHVAPPVFIPLSESRKGQNEVIDIDMDPVPQLMKKTNTDTRSPERISQQGSMEMRMDEQNLGDKRDANEDEEDEEDDEFGDLKFRF
ncbi:Mre11 complex subunit Nbs1 [Schizosaccharomyces cryophilus OY26]|uniref:Mre11 complex subunit Nbs1 n=1 Tax=Schizosaccharomyces cryophilus (strain OY26 / ATCC MYA-4695 / CBS 11777 / NBRC 106824 / NRRL Y48691) TaxID=653667 RepID=S9W5M6_SCHCR|nr:Mre11 complex subunit Nbs1 [Schizosaccharomyces cryophilus OY26]EPY53859.1 Mre11 complex subunit Nbs1 [Schizosaccharomyces cryophilus OY26]